jgi:hypothetical protein
LSDFQPKPVWIPGISSPVSLLGDLLGDLLADLIGDRFSNLRGECVPTTLELFKRGEDYGHTHTEVERGTEEFFLFIMKG